MGDLDDEAASWGWMDALLTSQLESYYRSSRLTEDGGGDATVTQGSK